MSEKLCLELMARAKAENVELAVLQTMYDNMKLVIDSSEVYKDVMWTNTYNILETMYQETRHLKIRDFGDYTHRRVDDTQ